MVCLSDSPRLRYPTFMGSASLVWCLPSGRSLYREPLCLIRVLPLKASHLLRHRLTLLDPLRSYGLMRRTKPLLLPWLVTLCNKSSQVAACPCWEMVLPDVISLIFIWVPGPVPRRASPVHLLVSSRKTSASPQS